MDQVKIDFVNNGEPFELALVPLGGQKATNKFREKNPPMTKEEMKADPRKFLEWAYEQEKLGLAWSIKNRFDKEDVDDLMRKIENHLSPKQLSEIFRKIPLDNYDDVKEEPPKDEAGK